MSENFPLCSNCGKRIDEQIVCPNCNFDIEKFEKKLPGADFTINTPWLIGQFTVFTWLPVIVIILPPNLWWMILIKIVAALILVAWIKHAFSPKWDTIFGFGAFVSINVVLFGLLLIAPWTPLRVVLLTIIIFNFWSEVEQIKKRNMKVHK